MNKRMRKSRARAAFTLLEVLMVVAIIGLLAAFVVPNLFGTQEKAQVDLEQAKINNGLNNALPLYRMHMGHFPREDDGGLMALVERPDDEDIAKKWAGPYVQAKDLKDTWGNDYIYEYPGQYNEDGYDLSSPGPDGETGTDDDITNWTRE